MTGPISHDLLKDSDTQRRTMVDCQIRTYDVTDQRLIARCLKVPRELFVPDNVRNLAYSDIGFVVPAASADREARYLLPPLVLARLLQGARIKPADRVLDVAPGLGYSSAILAGLAAAVVALEEPTGSGDLQAHLGASGLSNVTVRGGALADGAAADGPFDVIVVNGAVQTNPDALFAQLNEGGRLVTIRRPVETSPGGSAKAMCYEKSHANISGRFLFDATAPLLRAFRAEPQFVF